MEKSRFVWQACLLLSLGAALCLSGCGGEYVVPVQASFTIDGQPLADASVSFIRVEGQEGRAAFGMTDESGVAKLTTYDPFDGALPGNYAVVVIKPPDDAMTYEEVETDPNDIKALMKGSAPSASARRMRRKRVRTTIPEVYATQQTTPLKCEVARGMEPVVFDLTSNGLKK